MLNDVHQGDSKEIIKSMDHQICTCSSGIFDSIGLF